MNFGIYAIRNIVNNRRYIGSSSKLDRRWKQHTGDLRRQCHKNSYLQNAWNKYGDVAFVYEILEYCDKSLVDREEYWISNLKSHKDEAGYNFCKIPRASRLGCKSRPETIEKMRRSLSGENHPNWGRKLSSSHIENISKSQRGISKPTSGFRKQYVLNSPTGEKVKIVGLRKFCREHHLPVSIMWRIVNGKKKNYNGWSLYQHLVLE